MTSTLKPRLDGAHQAFVRSVVLSVRSLRTYTPSERIYDEARGSLDSWLPLAEEIGGKGRKRNVFSPVSRSGDKRGGGRGSYRVPPADCLSGRTVNWNGLYINIAMIRYVGSHAINEASPSAAALRREKTGHRQKPKSNEPDFEANHLRFFRCGYQNEPDFIPLDVFFLLQ